MKSVHMLSGAACLAAKREIHEARRKKISQRVRG